MSKVDKRGRLADDPFEYRVTKNGQVFISRGGRQVSTIAGARAERLIRDLKNGDEQARQLALAKATGNYRHSNERR
ncbi:MAG TPA: hypothetical protein VK585_00645 [Jiangellaceae bacterium]|nr:hypothetical protein [Jiangellaceae bacterium]